MGRALGKLLSYPVSGCSWIINLKQPLLAEFCGASAQGRVGLGAARGERLQRVRFEPELNTGTMHGVVQGVPAGIRPVKSPVFRSNP